MSHPGRLGEVANDRFGEFQFAEPGFRSMAAAGKPLLPFWVDGGLLSIDSGCLRALLILRIAAYPVNINHGTRIPKKKEIRKPAR